MILNRLALCLILSFVDTQHRFFNIKFVHFLKRIGNVIITLTDLWKIFEHVLRRHLEHLSALLVHQ